MGFRPFVYRIARQEGLTGWVMNTNEDVRIRVSGDPGSMETFMNLLTSGAPVASRVENILAKEIPHEIFPDFRILKSGNLSDAITGISPDIAVCPDCLDDITREGNRKDYAFVNCTNCGPRFTIIREMPYDRDKTSMASFAMCPDCRKEFEEVTDRRFHAQPTACDRCGPHYELTISGGESFREIGTILDRVSAMIASGGILLVKGLGGMHFCCDACSPGAVGKLRDIKQRDGKPFALMFRDISALRDYAVVGTEEERSLLSVRRPIVLLNTKDPGDVPLLSGNINEGLNLIGAMLPYLPFHHMLFSRMETPAVVLTSGNFASEPIVTDNREAVMKFSGHADGLLLHNREIVNRADDSVVRIMAGRERVVRRSRGYVPSPIRVRPDPDGILAFGAELANCFCAGKQGRAYLSQHIGDLASPENIGFYKEAMGRLIRLLRIKPSLLAADMHPDYASTWMAKEFGGLPLIRVQHHHAHIAACMAEHGLDEKVIGVAFDGTGYGEDGHTWGSEFLVCDLADYSRAMHIEYLPMPGGDRAAEEPWRMAFSWIYNVYGKDYINLGLPVIDDAGKETTAMLARMIDRNINCPLTSGAGRLFDAVSALLGLCRAAAYQAEGPMKLESLVLQDCRERYGFTIDTAICFDEMARAIVQDITGGLDRRMIATRFHNTIIAAIFETVNKISRKEKIGKVVLSGGVFQNKYLLEGAISVLEDHGFEVFSHVAVPPNDGGIALGQLVVASKRRELKCV